MKKTLVGSVEKEEIYFLTWVQGFSLLFDISQILMREALHTTLSPAAATPLQAGS